MRLLPFFYFSFFSFLLTLVFSVVLPLEVHSKVNSHFAFVTEWIHLDRRNKIIDIEDFKTLTLNEVQALRNESLLFDTRPLDIYIDDHIPGSVPLPEDLDIGHLREHLEMHTPAIQTAKNLIVFGENASDRTTLRMAKKLKSFNFGEILIFIGGWQAWTNQSKLETNALKVEP